MSEKINVVYIGPKTMKRDTVAGTRLVFPRHQPVPCEPDVAYRLTEFPSVWIYESDFKEHQAKEAERLAARQQAEAEAKAAAEAAAAAACMVVELNGQEIDLNKLNSAKLATLLESEELDIAPKGSKETVDEFRTRIRDALRG